jgi:hypothetical protein
MLGITPCGCQSPSVAVGRPPWRRHRPPEEPAATHWRAGRAGHSGPDCGRSGASPPVAGAIVNWSALRVALAPGVVSHSVPEPPRGPWAARQESPPGGRKCLLIYPAGMFWTGFGIFGFVGEKIFSAKLILVGGGGVKTLRRLTSSQHLRQTPHSDALWASYAFGCALSHGSVRFSIGPPAGEILLFQDSTYPAPPPCSPPRAAHAHGAWTIV